MSVNKAILVGNCTVDPEIKHLEGGTSVARFGLATNEHFKNKSGELVETVEFHKIVAWRHLADLAEKYIRKGRQLYVEGKITNRQYDDKDGNKKFISEIVADNIRLLGKKEDVGSGYSGPQQPDPQEGSDLPF
jgi:single-strand DNA-binding protein